MSLLRPSILGSSSSSGAGLENDVTLSNPPEDTVSDLSFATQGQFLAVASWDSKVRVYEIMNDGSSQPKAMFAHDGPILSTRWSPDSTKIVSGGCDKAVKVYDVATGQSAQIGLHNDGVKSVRFCECGPSNTPVVASASWDKTLKYWDMRSPQPVGTLEFSSKCYAMDSTQKLLVAATADRNLTIINLDNPTVKFRQAQSPLRKQVTTVACSAQGNRCALGSIEGRIAVQYVTESDQADHGFSFKCHRETKKLGTKSDHRVYSVNVTAFNYQYGALLTAGSDGAMSLWDLDSRHRFKAFNAYSDPITAACFNKEGTTLCYAIGYDWSKGYSYSKPDNPVIVKLHALKEDEVMRRRKDATSN